jgi:hypothetical protein
MLPGHQRRIVMPGKNQKFYLAGALDVRTGPLKAADGAEIGLRVLVQERGIDIELSENERLVFDALMASAETPAGCAVLL